MQTELSISLYEKIREFTKSAVSSKRYEHSVRTAKTLAQLCNRYGLNEDKAWLAGLAHDMCKDLTDEELLALAQKDGKPLSDFERSMPDLLHGRAAAVFIQEKFGITDTEIIDAIANHTFGSTESCDFALLLFVADKIEPGRPQSTDEYRAGLFAKSCHGIVLAVLQENIEYLTAHGKTVAEPTLLLRDKLKKLVSEE